MNPMIYNGIAHDPRSEEQKALDYQHKDIAGAIIIDWKEKTEWKKYTPREQDGSLSCVGQSGAKALEILNGIVESAHPIYRSRINYPDGGMWLGDLGDILKKIGTTTEQIDPSQFQNETTMNRDITVQTPTKIGGYVFVNAKSIDEIAQAIELNKHCILIVHCNKNEWTAIPTFNNKEIDFGHAIVGVDYFIKDGKKCILIEDSTGHFNSLDGKGQRIITEDFLKSRFDGAMYLILEKPINKHIFYKLLKYGMRDSEVAWLQKVLKISADGIFGKQTLKAVQAFQSSHGLIPDGIVGKLTNSELNK